MNESDNIIDRINSFIEERNLTRSQFADTCGIPRPTISQMLSGKNKKIGDDVISVIHKTYPEIPMMWLLFGEGEKPKFCASDQACENLLFPHDSPNPVENEILKGVESRSIAQNMPIVNQLPQEKKISKIVVFKTSLFLSFTHGCVLKAESLRLVFALTLPFVNLAMCDMARMRFTYAAEFVFKFFTRQI